MLALIAAAMRSLLRNPAFVLTSAGTLALGIGATIALFSAVNAALLKPLPYPHFRDLYSVRTFFPTGRFTSGLVGVEELAALRQMTDGVEETAAALRIPEGTVTSRLSRALARLRMRVEEGAHA